VHIVFMMFSLVKEYGLESVLALNSDNYILQAINFLVALAGHTFVTSFWKRVKYFLHVTRGGGGLFYAKLL
jgi:hypothetical protein